MNTFIYIATGIFFFLSVIWSNKDWRNLFVKFVFAAMALFGGLLTLHTLGYVVRGLS